MSKMCDLMTAEIINGKPISDIIKKKAIKKIKILYEKYKITPRILTINVGDNSESKLYMKLRDKACEQVGIESIHNQLSSNVSEKELLNVIKNANEDQNIHGILIQFPLPNHISIENVLNTIDPRKDVEGLTPFNMGETLLGIEYLVPCTPLAVIKIIESINLNLKGKNVVIINHSMIVGKPLTAMCLNRNATVSVCHVYTESLIEFTKKADILITAAGVPNLITSDHVKNNVIIIDVAIIQTENGLTGDIDFNNVLKKADYITPVPGGVGPVTVACAIENMIKAFENCVEDD
jgi:methylenetetrahydrofolate dehydrogenase (NADP+)/methenyltetrahydrofolate cyclohydrolase